MDQLLYNQETEQERYKLACQMHKQLTRQRPTFGRLIDKPVTWEEWKEVNPDQPRAYYQLALYDILETCRNCLPVFTLDTGEQIDPSLDMQNWIEMREELRGQEKQTERYKLAMTTAKVLGNSTFPLRFPVWQQKTGQDLTAWGEYLNSLVASLQEQLLIQVRHLWQQHLYHAPQPLDFPAYQGWHVKGTREDYQDYLEENLTFFKSFA